MDTQYTSIARLYDRLNTSVDYQRVADFLLEKTAAYSKDRKVPELLLDLAKTRNDQNLVSARNFPAGLDEDDDENDCGQHDASSDNSGNHLVVLLLHIIYFFKVHSPVSEAYLQFGLALVRAF